MKLKTMAVFIFLSLSITGCDYLPTAKNKALDAVREKLIDPDSAKFSDVFESHEGFERVSYCGLVNAKNRMGAYAGKSPFIYEKRLYEDEIEVHLAPEPLTNRDFQEYLGYMHYDPSHRRKEQWAKIYYGCKFSENWKDFCGTDSPYPEHRLCSSFFKKDVQDILEKEFPRY